MNGKHVPDETVTDEEIYQSMRTLNRLYGDEGMKRIAETLREMRRGYAIAFTEDLKAVRDSA